MFVPGDTYSSLVDLRQGMYVLDETARLAIISGNLVGADDLILEEERGIGLAIVSQSCDIVQPRADKLHVALIVELPPEKAGLATAGHMPSFAPLPAAGLAAFVALDTVCAVRKQVLESIRWREGVFTPAESAELARAIARKFNRFAFPDEFNECLRPVAEYLRAKHSKFSAEGDVLRRVLEIRAEADPVWAAEGVECTVYFILPAGELPPVDVDQPLPEVLSSATLNQLCEHLVRPESHDFRGAIWRRYLELLEEKCGKNDRVSRIAFEAIGEDEMTLAEYRRSQPLALDYLTPLSSDLSPGR